jgi:hypothetical protein
MGDRGETVRGGEARFNFPQEAFLDFHHRGAARAYEMMVMAVVTLANQFKPRRAVAKINPFDHVHPFEQMHRAVNRRQIALLAGDGGKDFPAGQRMRLLAQNFENDLARTGDLPRVAAQPAGECGHFLPFGRLRADVCFHFAADAEWQIACGYI